MDPFEKLPEEIHESLLQHFDVGEILKVLSIVSKNWYRVIGTSNVCMKKVNLNLKSKRKNDFVDRLEILRWMSRKESRNYQHLQINCLLDERISSEVWSFLQSVSESVESINIRSMKIDQHLGEMSIPKLESLKMMFVPREAMNHLLLSTSSLKKLILRNEFSLCYADVDYTPSDATINSIKEFAQRNQKLEELEIQGRPHFLSFFHQNLSDAFSFKLKKLVVKIEMSAEKIPNEHTENFLSFLSLQASNLEHIYVDSCGADIIHHVFNRMPALSFIRLDIELSEPNKFVISDLNLTPNKKIKQVEFPYIVLFDDVKEFLELTPNVEEILVGHMNPRLLDYAAKSLVKLKSIVYRYDDCAGGCDETYKNMKQENPEINQNIKLSICNEFL